MKLWFMGNRFLITTGAAALIFGYILYTYSATPLMEHNQRAQNISVDIERVYRESEPGEKSMNLVYLILGEIVHSQEMSFWQGLGRHVALALFVAGILILFIEIHSHQERRKEARTYISSVAANVWRAVSGRLVPDEICKEIDGILKADILKEDCQYTITIGVQYEGLSEIYVVVRRELSYFARNLTGVPSTNYTVVSSIKNDLPDLDVTFEGKAIKLPMHLKCEIEGQEIVPSKYLVPDNRRELRYNFSLPRDGTRRVYLVWDEVCRLSDANFYITFTPIKDLTVRVICLGGRVRLKEIRLLHPRTADFVALQEDLWTFKGGILPGQGFSISWGPQDDPNRQSLLQNGISS